MNVMIITAGSDDSSVFKDDDGYCLYLAKELGSRVRTCVIKPCICLDEKEGAEFADTLSLTFGKRTSEFTVYKVQKAEYELFLIESEAFFNSERVASMGYENLLFNAAACEFSARMAGDQTIICTYGTPSAASQIYMRYSDNRPVFKKTRTIHLINTLKNKPYITAEEAKLLPQKEDVYQIMRLCGKNDLNRSAIVCADRIIVPSTSFCNDLKSEAREPRYCHTIRQFGFKFKGIEKGIDYRHLDRVFDRDYISQKESDKLHVQRLLGLRVNKDTPLLVMFCREKCDMEYSLLTAAVPSISTGGAQTVICVDNDSTNVDLRSHNSENSRIVAASAIGSKLTLLAAADICISAPVISPSGTEAAYACRCGTVPVVFSTGGLKDRVSYYDRTTRKGNGFTFNTYNPHDMLYTLWDALGMYRNERNHWQKVMRNAMSCDFSIRKNAKELLDYISK